MLQQVLLTPEQLRGLGLAHPVRHRRPAAPWSALYLRRNLEETEAYIKAEARSRGTESLLRALLRHPREIMIVVGPDRWAARVAFYTYTTYMQKYLVNTVGIEQVDQSTLVSARDAVPVHVPAAAWSAPSPIRSAGGRC